jgi:hypothetical protein
MPRTKRKAIWAILLTLVFLFAQFHFCADLKAGDANGHFCAFCSTTGVAIATYVPVLELGPGAVRLELRPVQTPVSTETALSISSRAPPIL